MTKDDPYKPPSASLSPPGSPATIPLHRVVIDSWLNLFRSRESLLLHAYRQSLLSLESESLPPQTLEEARRQMNPNPLPSAGLGSGIEGQEAKLVLGNRIIAGWLVFWSTLIPTALIGWLCYRQIRGRPDSLLVVLGYVPLACVILFPFHCVVCLGVRSFLLGPFNLFVGRLLAGPDGPDGEPAPAGEAEVPIGHSPVS